MESKYILLIITKYRKKNTPKLTFASLGVFVINHPFIILYTYLSSLK